MGGQQVHGAGISPVTHQKSIKYPCHKGNGNYVFSVTVEEQKKNVYTCHLQTGNSPNVTPEQSNTFYTQNQVCLYKCYM